MVECGICLEEYEEGDLELHRQMCVVRLMFRCSLCDEDYVSKEGLWNHLDLHEIADESKELHYQEVKAKHKLHQCVLCNDQRAYLESPYWEHVFDVHDGFFLRCSDCGKNFRSEKHKNDHAINHGKARDEPLVSDFNALGEIQVPFEVQSVASDAERSKLSRGEQSSNSHGGLTNRMTDNSIVNLSTANDAGNHVIEKESHLPAIKSTKYFPPRFSCDNCGMTYSSKRFLLRHKAAKYSCLEGRQQKCPHCRKNIQITEFQAHVSICENKKCSCELCPSKFQTSKYLASHMRNVHHQKRVLKNEKQDPNQVKNRTEETTNLAEKRTRRSSPENLVSSSDSSSSSNVGEDTDISTLMDDIADKSVQPNVENSSSRSSGTTCSYCGKECAKASILRCHILKSHQPTKCSICGFTFQGYSRLRYHKIMKHTKPKYECAKCLKKFHYRIHCKHHSNLCDPIQSALSSHKNSDELILQDGEDPKVAVAENSNGVASSTKCSHCGINESTAVNLARHILIHHDPVACDICGITLSSFSQAQHHMKTKHKNSKLKCPHCSVRFGLSKRLQKHVTKCANENALCDFCGRMCKDVSAVNRHRSVCHVYKRTMEQEQKNDETCLPDETDSSTVMEEISPSLVESAFAKTGCNYCNEVFSSPGYLSHHMKISHELTKCDICGITVIGLSARKNHKVISHKEPKYECATCGKKFHCKTRYDVHCSACERKMYLCKLCGRTFKTVYIFNRHCKNAHPSSLKNIELVRVQNNVRIMKVTAEETTISALTNNLSTEVVVSNSRSNEHSSANFNEDELVGSQVIDKKSRIVSGAPLNDSRESQVVSEKTLQPRVENLSNNPLSCNICGVTFKTYYQIKYHRRTKHTEKKFKCPHCSRRFHDKRISDRHASRCADLQHSCDLCGQKFNLQSIVENHMKRVHQGSRPLRNTITEGADCTEEEKQNNVEKIDAAEEITSCMICRITFASTDELMNHKCTNSTIVPLGENTDLNLEIKVEETMLQEQEYQYLHEDPAGSSFATALHPHGAKSKDDEAEDAADLEIRIKVKEEYLEDE